MLENSDTSNIIKQNRSAALNWWIEIHTSNPNCIYYFGEFENYMVAAEEQYGFVRDLIVEGAIVISLEIKQCQPQQLTIYQHQTEAIAFPIAIAFNG